MEYLSLPVSAGLLVSPIAQYLPRSEFPTDRRDNLSLSCDGVLKSLPVPLIVPSLESFGI